MMTNAEMWALLVGAALPAAIAVIQQSHWSNTRRAIVAFIACVVAGLGTTYFAGTLVFDRNNQALVTNILIVLTAAYATYHGFYKSSGLGGVIEHATNLPKITITSNDVPSEPPATPPLA